MEITTNAARKPSRPARETSTVDTAATPAAPPISRIVSTRPDANPDVDSETPESAPICTDGRAQSDRHAGEQERGEQVGDVVGVARHPRKPEHADRQQRQAGDQQLAHADESDEAGAGAPRTR